MAEMLQIIIVILLHHSCGSGSTVTITLNKLNMTQIKLQKQSIESSLTGITPDVDENNIFFNRFTSNVKHPTSAEMHYWEFNKSDSNNLLTEKEDGIYTDDEDINYLKDSWSVEEYEIGLNGAWRDGEKGVDIPDEWWGEVILFL